MFTINDTATSFEIKHIMLSFTHGQIIENRIPESKSNKISLMNLT